MDGGEVADEIGEFGGLRHVGEEGASEVEGCAAVDGDGAGGATWLGEVHVCGESCGGLFEVRVWWFVVVVVVENRQM